MFNQRFIQWNDLNMVLGLEIETKSFISCWAFGPNSTLSGKLMKIRWKGEVHG